jgi:hypothetical protein
MEFHPEDPTLIRGPFPRAFHGRKVVCVQDSRAGIYGVGTVYELKYLTSEKFCLTSDYFGYALDTDPAWFRLVEEEPLKPGDFLW